LGILFEFIEDDCRIFLPGGGKNRYQFIAATDLARACELAAHHGQSDVFHLGSDEVPTLRTSIEAAIEKAQSHSRVVSLPVMPLRVLMDIAHRLGVSPLGPYHIQMISEDFAFDCDKAKKSLGWRPQITNTEMLMEAMAHYVGARAEIETRGPGVAAHRRVTPMGLIRVLKWLA
jgi:nucleoside-diphosphate-sugar epimerase